MRIKNSWYVWMTDQRRVYVSYFVQVDQNTGDGVQETGQLVYIIIIITV